MGNIVVGLLFILFGVCFVLFNKTLAIITEHGNRARFGLPFSLNSYEWGFKVSGVILVLFGVALAIGEIHIKH